MADVVFNHRQRALRAVSDEFLVEVPLIVSPSRRQRFVRARVAAAFVLRNGLGCTWCGVAESLQRSDHHSAVHWLKRADELRASDVRFRARTDRLLTLVAGWRAADVAELRAVAA